MLRAASVGDLPQIQIFHDETAQRVDTRKPKTLQEGRKRRTRSLFVDHILEVSFTKEGKRTYRVQWESTWESEEDLLTICKDVLRSYWEEQSRHIVLEKYATPNIGSNGLRTAANSLFGGDADEQVISNPSTPETNEKNDTINGIPEQYKNVGFAKSVRENFAKQVPSENKFDFVEHYLAEKLHPKTQETPKKTKRAIPCDSCRETFSDQNSLANHKICAHGVEPPTYQCNLCFKMFARLGELKRHLTTHSPHRSQYCFFCKKTYKTKNHLHRHIKAKHNNSQIPESILSEMLTIETIESSGAGRSENDSVFLDAEKTIVDHVLADPGRSVLKTMESPFTNAENSLMLVNDNTITAEFTTDQMLNQSILTDDTVFFQEGALPTDIVMTPQNLTDAFLTSADVIQMDMSDKPESYFAPFPPGVAQLGI